jgi:hypothetical protein
MVAVGGAIGGTVSGEDGTPVVGARLFLRRTTTPAGLARKREWYAVTGNLGNFRFDGLPYGDFTLCAEAAGSVWLNPCEWGLHPPAVTITRARRAVSVAVSLKKGAAVPIRIDDPGRLLAQYEGKPGGGQILMGVSSDAHVFHWALMVSQDSGGRDLRIVVPFDTQVRLVVNSSFFQLANAAGIALPRTRSTLIPVAVSAGQVPPALRFTVTSGGG